MTQRFASRFFSIGIDRQERRSGRVVSAIDGAGISAMQPGSVCRKGDEISKWIRHTEENINPTPMQRAGSVSDGQIEIAYEPEA